MCIATYMITPYTVHHSTYLSRKYALHAAHAVDEATCVHACAVSLFYVMSSQPHAASSSTEHRRQLEHQAFVF